MSEQQEVTPEGSVAPVYVDPTPPEPVEEPVIVPTSPIRQQSPNGQWWEQSVNDDGQPEWVPVEPSSEATGVLSTRRPTSKENPR